MVLPMMFLGLDWIKFVCFCFFGLDLPSLHFNPVILPLVEPSEGKHKMVVDAKPQLVPMRGHKIIYSIVWSFMKTPHGHS